MGLRERNAAQTRELILHTALDLFVAQGFEATRMEEIAEAADIGASTLYRYFPTKDQLLTEPLALHGQMAAELRDRPADEPLDLALGHAVRALIQTPRPDSLRVRQLFTALESAPGARARLLEEASKERILLAQAIADRLGRPEDDVFAQMTARVTMSVLELVGPGNPEDVPPDNATAVEETLRLLAGTLDRLRAEPPVVPRLERA